MVSRPLQNVETRPRRRVTINDLAGHLGLTKSTVSRALNDYPDISPSTRARVKRQAEIMGYRPLSQAQAIRTGRTRSIGLVVQSDLHDGYRPFLSEFFAGMAEEAGSQNWTLAVANADVEEEVSDVYRRLVDERKVDGFVLPRTRTRDPRVTLLRSLDVPFVLYGRTADSSGCAWFDILGEDAMSEAVQRLHALGHRRIAHIAGQDGYYYSEIRLKGYRDGLAKAGLSFDARLVVRNCADHENGLNAGRKLLALDDCPTAVVAAVDIGALGFYQAAAERGLQIGKDVSVISYDGTTIAAYANPPLSTYEVDNRHAGARLASLLIRRIRGEAPETLRELAPASFVERSSAAPLT